jgi:flagellar hook-basal body complex protein FliE
MEISSISNILGPSSNTNTNNSNVKNQSFENMLNNAIKDVNKEQIEGYKAMEGLATGKVTNLQEAVQQIEEAELTMKLGLEVKNKALNAYKEVMRMQV